MRPLPPLELPWTLKPLESARTGLERLPGGRLRFWLSHDVVRGVTPAMLVLPERLQQIYQAHIRPHLPKRKSSSAAENKV